MAERYNLKVHVCIRQAASATSIANSSYYCDDSIHLTVCATAASKVDWLVYLPAPHRPTNGFLRRLKLNVSINARSDFKEREVSLIASVDTTYLSIKLAALTRRTCQCTVHVLRLKIHQITPTPILLLDWLNGSSQFHAGDNHKDYIDNFNFILRILRLACVALKYCKACELWCHSQGGHVWNSNRSAVELYST